MPLISVSQLLNKTIYLKKPSKFYRAADIVTLGDKAQPVSNELKTGYFFKLHSYLAPAPQPYTKYGQQYAKRSDYYWLFYGNDGKYYAIKYDETKFSLDKLLQQGVKTVAQEIKEKEQENLTAGEKLQQTITDIFTGAASTAKTVLFIGVGVLAVGYLLPKILKK